MNIFKAKCTACRTDAPKVTAEEEKELLSKLKEWCILNCDNVKILEREYMFNNFINAVAFANKIAEAAEKANHHPEIIIRWGSCTVKWWTHAINGLHRNDFIMAAKSDSLFQEHFQQ